MKIELVATCLFGLEHLLGEEIDSLGYERISTINGRVTFLGDEEAIALSNIFLRYAERVYVKLGSFSAPTFDALFEGTRALAWERFIGSKDAFPVKGHSIKSALHSIPDCQAIVKKAIVRRLGEKYGMTVFPEEGIKYQIEFFILNDEATLMIDLGRAASQARIQKAVKPCSHSRNACLCNCRHLSPSRGRLDVGPLLRQRHYCH